MAKLRYVLPSDAEELSNIYRYYVEKTAISFEYTAPDENEMKQRITEISTSYPFLVIEEHGTVEGYAYAHAFSSREAYRRSAEVTIYLRHGMERQHYGTLLYDELERQLKEIGVHNLYAIVMYPGEGSVEFHEKRGYTIAGKLTDCGEKFGRLWSVVYMEKHI